jgi:hypothetical protein
MSVLFEVDQLTVRARSDSELTRSRSYDLLDPAGAALGSATQETGPAGTLARQVARSRATMPADFAVRDAAGGLLARVSKRAPGLLRRRVRTEVSLADGVVVAVATAPAGGGRFAVSQPSGTPIARLERAGRVLLAVTGPDASPYGTVDLETGGRPNGYRIRFEPGAPLAARIATVAVVIVFDSLRGA